MREPARPVTAVVVHHGRPDALAATVASLRRATAAPLHVVVVDNASDRPAPDGLAGVDRVVRPGANLGFGGGANVGLRLFLEGPARLLGEWAVVLPHDVEVGDGCVDRVVGVAAARPRAGLACAEFGADEVPVVDPYFGGMTVPCLRAGDWAPAGYPHGTLLAARRACLDEVGLFDEAYFAYCEEADLALRARARGWRSGQVWGAVVRNTGLGSTEVADYLMARNTLHLVRRWFGRYRAGVRLAIEARSLGDPVHRRAAADFVRGRFGPPPPSLSRAARRG